MNLKEFFVSLGFKDELSDKITNAMGRATKSIQNFSDSSSSDLAKTDKALKDTGKASKQSSNEVDKSNKKSKKSFKDLAKSIGSGAKKIGSGIKKVGTTVGKSFQKIGKAVSSAQKGVQNAVKGIAKVIAVMVKYARALLESEEQAKSLSTELGISMSEARATNTALNAMGKTLDEIKADPSLTKQFEELKALSEDMKVPEFEHSISSAKEFINMFQKIKVIASSVLQWISVYFMKYIEAPIERIKKRVKGTGNLKKTVENIGKVIGTVFANIVKMAERVIGAILDIVKGVKKLFGGLTDESKQSLAVIGGILLAIFSPVTAVVGIIAGLILLFDDFKTHLEGGESAFGDFWDKLINNGIIEKFENIKQKFIDFINSVIEWFDKFLARLNENKALDNWKKALTSIKEIFTTLMDSIKNIVETISGGKGESSTFLADLVGVWLPKLVEFLAFVISLLLKIVTFIIQFVIVVIKKVIQFVIYLAKTIKQKAQDIGEWISNLVNDIKTFFSNLKENIINTFNTIKEAIVNKFNEIKDGIQSKFTEAKDFVIKLFTEIPDEMSEVGKNIIKSMWDGILEMGSWLKDKVTGFFSGIWGSVKGIFGGDSGSAEVSEGHSDGGIFNKEHNARVSEGNQEEVIVPLTKPAKAKNLINYAKDKLNMGDDFLKNASKMLGFQGQNVKQGNSTTSNSTNNQEYNQENKFNITVKDNNVAREVENGIRMVTRTLKPDVI